MARLITSTKNRHVAYCRSLQRPSSRHEAGAFLIEGMRLTQEALTAGIAPELVLYDRGVLEASNTGRDISGARRGDGV